MCSKMISDENMCEGQFGRPKNLIFRIIREVISLAQAGVRRCLDDAGEQVCGTEDFPMD